MLSHGAVMFDGAEGFFADGMLGSIFADGVYSVENFNFSDNSYLPAPNPGHSQTQAQAQRFPYTKVFRASDMNSAEPCVNGVQHLSSSPSLSLATSDMGHDGNADMDSDFTSCVKCQETVGQKRAKRREQNRQSQRKFRAKKEAKLSDARARVRDLEALVRAQEKTNIELKLTLEDLGSGELRTDANARRKLILGAEEQMSTCLSKMTNS